MSTYVARRPGPLVRGAMIPMLGGIGQGDDSYDDMDDDDGGDDDDDDDDVAMMVVTTCRIRDDDHDDNSDIDVDAC